MIFKNTLTPMPGSSTNGDERSEQPDNVPNEHERYP
jgi:hypothetical protein